MNAKRILIVGGVAGGAACAARLRRLDEHAEIVMFDRGPHVSFANCGLPYYIGGVIPSEEDLLLADVDLFRDRFHIHVHPRTEVLSVDREQQTITVRDLATGEERAERYDALVLSPGASPLRPPLPGIDLPGIFTLRNIPDSNAIKQWIAAREARSAVIVGAGFIGLEMAENLVHLGMEVTVVEMLDQVMPPLDPEMAAMVAERLRQHDVQLALGDGVAGFSEQENGEKGKLSVRTQSGSEYPADLVILSIGVRPETGLAKDAGLEIGERGGIRVNGQMQTSDPRIWAVGDAVEVRDAITGNAALVPLAGPAARQGRVAAEAICGRPSTFRPVQGTAICEVFGLQVATIGASEKALRRAGWENFEKVHLHPAHHVAYYPGAKRMQLKLLFDKESGRILGAQGIGEAGVDRRIDVISMAIQKQGTIHDLAEAELCYAPQFGGAKDAVNFVGMTAENVLDGDLPQVHWDEPAGDDTLFLDVRDPVEFASGHLPDARNIPLGTLRENLGELPKDADIRVYCAVGQRGYLATRILLQHGLRARNIPGGWSLRPYVVGNAG